MDGDAICIQALSFIDMDVGSLFGSTKRRGADAWAPQSKASVTRCKQLASFVGYKRYSTLFRYGFI